MRNALLPLLLATTTLVAQTPGDVVARIHGRPVTRREAPDGQTLMGLVIGVLVDDFVKSEKVEVSREEIAALAAHTKHSMERSRAEWRARLKKLEAEAASPSDATKRKKLDEEIASLRETIALDESARDSFQKVTPAQLEQIDQEVAKSALLRYKVNQALYRKYGGRVIFQQFGPEPLDAYHQLLLEQQQKGTFAILDKSYEKGFWEYVTNDAMHTFIPAPEAKELMTIAWWLKDLPGEEEDVKPKRGERVDVRIDGAKLSSEEGGFTITPPDKGDWSEVTSPPSKAARTMFWTGSAYNRGMNVEIVRDGKKSAACAFARDVVSESVEIAIRAGFVVSDVNYERSTLPVPGSCRFSYVEKTKQWPPFHTFGYVTGEGVKVTLRTGSSEAKEPAAFTAFVSSFAASSAR